MTDTAGVMPPPTGNVWMLPGDRIHGADFLAAWRGPDRGPFHIDASRDLETVWLGVLPPGWRLEASPEPLLVSHERFLATGSVACSGDTLVVTRRYRMIRGTTPRDGLARLGEAIERVRQFERGAVVLTRE